VRLLCAWRRHVKLTRATDRRTQARLRPSERIAPSVERQPAVPLKGRAAAPCCFGCEGRGLGRETSRSERIGRLLPREQRIRIVRNDHFNASAGIIGDHVITNCYCAHLRATVRT
jgi:hypothetical protein